MKNTTFLKELKTGINLKMLLSILLGAAICTFGIHNIHQRTNITEGGVIGLMLLIEHWLGFSPAIITPILDIICYALAFKSLGIRFIKISIISTFSVSMFYKLWELFPPMLPDLSSLPLVAAVVGGLFVGIGVGIIVRNGGSSGGDDALALSISKITKCQLSRAYIFTDFVILALSLTYIPFSRIMFSVVTVLISGITIEKVHGFHLKKRRA